MLRPLSSELLFSKNDSEDIRLGERIFALPFSETREVALASLQKAQEPFVMVGYPDDEGIRLNGGRPGAALAPQKMREVLYKTTSALPLNRPLICDLGDLNPESLALPERHLWCAPLIEQALSQNKKWIGLGGGHDYGYSEGHGFLQWAQKGKLRPLVLNFDAHLDVRPYKRLPHSGTPFFRLLEDFRDFGFYEVGLQPQCNSLHHRQWAEKKGAKLFDLASLSHSVTPLLNDLKSWPVGTPCFVSLDIDVFSQSLAPGASASWPMGLELKDFQKIFDFILETFDVKVFGIYEVSPSLDRDHMTSRLAAQLIHHFLFHKPFSLTHG